MLQVSPGIIVGAHMEEQQGITVQSLDKFRQPPHNVLGLSLWQTADFLDIRLGQQISVSISCRRESPTAVIQHVLLVLPCGPSSACSKALLDTTLSPSCANRELDLTCRCKSQLTLYFRVGKLIGFFINNDRSNLKISHLFRFRKQCITCGCSLCHTPLGPLISVWSVQTPSILPLSISFIEVHFSQHVDKQYKNLTSS